jgi:hypothetical protein
MKKIPIKTLANWAGITERRLRQLGEEGRLPKIIKGAMAMPDAVKQLFAHYQGEGLARERLLLTKARREMAEQKLEDQSPSLLTMLDVEHGLEQVRYRFMRLTSSDLYNGTGLKPTEAVQRVVQQAAAEAIEDAKKFIEQGLSRRREMAHKDGAEAAGGETVPMAEHLQILRVIVEQLESLPVRATAELGITVDQAAALHRMVDRTRTEIADRLEAVESEGA